MIPKIPKTTDLFNYECKIILFLKLFYVLLKLTYLYKLPTKMYFEANIYKLH